MLFDRALGHVELLGYLTFSFRSDDGREMTVSIDPYTRNPSQEKMFAIATAVYCD
ncbi:MAG TPA: hypothetical protein VGP70_14115 [Actinomadura sp.]|nr:hypothetical protein [Actinomadura sp.]